MILRYSMTCLRPLPQEGFREANKGLPPLYEPARFAASMPESEAAEDGPGGGCLERPWEMKRPRGQDIRLHPEAPGSPFLPSKPEFRHSDDLNTRLENQQK